ncbi:MAG: EamA family transporter, partial [Primorskyibacter sp.]
MQARGSRNVPLAPPVSPDCSGFGSMNALALGLIAALCWGIHDITIRYLSRSVPILAALLCVLVVGAVFQIGILGVRQPDVVIPMRALLYASLAGVAFLIASMGLYFAFERGPVRVVAPVIASYPILSIGFAVAGGSRVSLWQGLAVVVILVGVALVATPTSTAPDILAPNDTPAQDTAPPDIPAIGPTLLLAGMSAMGFACTFKLGQMAAAVSDEITSALIMRLVALVLLAGGMVAFMVHRRQTVRGTFWPGRHALVPLACMGVLDGVALLSVISAASLPNPEYAAVTSSVFGLITVVLAWAFLKERMTALKWSGCLLAFAGIGY